MLGEIILRKTLVSRELYKEAIDFRLTLGQKRLFCILILIKVSVLSQKYWILCYVFIYILPFKVLLFDLKQN